MTKPSQTPTWTNQQTDKTDKNEKEIQQAVAILAGRIEKASNAKDGKSSDANAATVRGDIIARN
jgi:hypothetical protein